MLRPESEVIHHGGERYKGSLVTPIFQSAVFEPAPEEIDLEPRYPRLSNLPNQTELARALAATEGGEDALVTASGMAAISSTLLSVLKGGGHLLAQSSLYGGTYGFLTKHLRGLGAEYTLIDAADAQSWARSLTERTRAIYVEAITNPLVEIADHRAIVDFAKKHRLLSIIDNTFASPVNFRPLDLGYDVVVHSCTKYLNGHSDLVAGVVVGRRALVRQVHDLVDYLGGSLDAHACYLLSRGLKTLFVRVRQQNENALAIAEHLSRSPLVDKVNYPGLGAHPQHARARELFRGFGGMLSFEVKGGEEAARRAVQRVKLITHAPSLGGVETLMTRPVATSHRGLSPEERERMGVRDSLIRMSVGIEHVEDLIADIDQALAG